MIVGRAIHPPWNEGTRVIARNTALAGSASGHVRVISVTNGLHECGEGPGDPRISHVRTNQPYGIRSDYAPLARIVRRLERLRPRRAPWVAHLIGAPLILAPWVRFRGGRVIAHVTLTSQAYQGRIDELRGKLAWRLFGRWIDAWACSSVPVRDSLVRRGQSRDNLHVLPPATNTETFRPLPRAQARKVLGWSAQDVVVAYVGTVSPLRFPAGMVVEALRLAAAAVPRLRLAAFAPLATHEYNIDWAASNVAARTDDKVPVTLKLGDLSEAEKALVYSAADALLLPFQAQVAVEPPLTLLEGMACGSVPFVSPAANRSGIVRDHDNGFEWATPQELATSLVAFLAQPPAERKRIASRARETIVRDYGMKAAARRIHDLWHEVSSTRARPGDGDGVNRGVSVAVVGPDGAGKSTLVAALREQAGMDAFPIYLGVDRTAATHTLPTTRWLVRRRAQHAARPEPGSVPPVDPATARRNRVRSAVSGIARRARPFVAFPHEVMEFGYRMLVAGWARRQGRVVLFDRYLYDSLVDCSVDRLGLGPRLRAHVLASLGRPDLMLVLDAPAAVLFARKGEHDPERLERVRHAVRAVASRARSVVVIDATLPPEQVAKLAAAAISGARVARDVDG